MKLKHILLGALAAGVAALGIGNVALAADTYHLAKDQTHSGALYVTSSHITIDGTVDGSVYCMAPGNLTIRGTVKGDVICATGGTAELTGTVEQDVRLAAGVQAKVGGVVGRDASVVSADKAELLPGARVAGDLHLQATTATLHATVEKNSYISANALTVEGSARFMGNLTYSAINQLSLQDGQVAGKVEFKQVDHNSDALQSFLVGFLMMLALSLAVTLVAPRFMHRSSEITRKSFGLTVLTGLAVLIFAPIIGILLLITLIGWPVLLILVPLYLVMLFLSPVFFAYLLGSFFFAGSKNVIVRMIAGIVFFMVLMVIPVVNLIAVVVAGIVGSGMLVRTLTHGYKAPRYSLRPPAAAPPMPRALQGSDEASDDVPQPSKKSTKSTKKSSKK